MLAMSASGAAWPEDPPFFDVPSALLDRLAKAQTEQQLVDRLLKELRQADADGNGLNRADVDLAAQVEQAQKRGAILGRALAYDLDNDGVVTADEVARVAAYQSQRNDASKERQQKFVETMVAQTMLADRDGDGKLTMAEMLQSDADTAKPNRRTEFALQLLELDQDRDGTLSEDEAAEAARRAFRTADYDGDGQLSAEEVKLLAPARRLAQALRGAKPCDLPAAGDSDQVVVFGAYNGGYQPNVTVAGQDVQTSLMKLEIEPGNTPLYLVIEAQFPTIWQLTGAVERVARAVVLPGYSGAKDGRSPGGGAGLIGLPREKITFLPAGSCGKPYHDPEGEQAQVRARVVERLTGHAPVAALGTYSAWTVRLPSGQVAEDKPTQRARGTEGNDIIILTPEPRIPEEERKWKGHEDSYGNAANLIDVDPADVISPLPAEVYQVLPHQYGLRQLVEEGKLERTKDGYRIVQAIPRFPPGLTGAHYTTFILPQGMPMPAGDSGHSKIILEKPAP